MLAVKPLNNKEVFGFATALALQISRPNGKQAVMVSISYQRFHGTPQLAQSPWLASVTEAIHRRSLVRTQYLRGTCESTGEADFYELPIMARTDPGLS